MRLLTAAALLLSASMLSGTPAFAAAEPPAGLSVRETGAGVFITDAKGMALYTYAQDNTPGKSACKADCLKAWPAAVAPADAKANGKWSVITRDDGTLQWAYRGKPLYTYAKDSYAGGALGDRVGNAWSVAFEPIATPPGIAVRSIYVGRVLTDARGHTLYMRSDEKAGGKSACTEACAETWSAVTAPQMANAMGDWTPVPREDGSLQWSYKGKRLYTNAHDVKPGQLEGEGVDKVWTAVVLEPAAPLPSWVTVRRADMGEIYADEKGMTLYTFSGSMAKIKETMCDDACMAKVWKPVVADANAKPTGEWTILNDKDETGKERKVWAYKGNIVYTHTRDTAPGGVSGDKWTAGVGGFGGQWAVLPRKRDYEEQ
jgi:predicted lipoprotein with Yx(FWY)xxD motif